MTGSQPKHIRSQIIGPNQTVLASWSGIDYVDEGRSILQAAPDGSRLMGLWKVIARKVDGVVVKEPGQ